MCDTSVIPKEAQMPYLSLTLIIFQEWCHLLQLLIGSFVQLEEKEVWLLILQVSVFIAQGQGRKRPSLLSVYKVIRKTPGELLGLCTHLWAMTKGILH